MFTTHERGCGYTFGLIVLSVCSVRAVTFESLDLETSILVSRYVFTISRSFSYVKVIGSRSRSYEQKTGFTSVTKYTDSRVVRLRLEGKLVDQFS